MPRLGIFTVTLAALATALLLVFAPSATADDRTPGFGTIVGDIEDFEHVLEQDNSLELMFYDSDGDGQLDRDEPVYLSDSSTVESGDLRITSSIGGEAFTRVSSADADHDRDLETLDGEFRFFDVDATGSLSPGDTLYYDIDTTSDGEASRGDVILAGVDAGTLVTTTHEYNRFGLTDLEDTPTFGFYDEDEDGTQDDDEAYILDIGDNDYVTIGDVRLGDTPGGDAGTIVAFGDADATYLLQDFDDDLEFQFIGDGTYSSNDRTYLTHGEQVQRNAIRLANPMSDHEPGSQVQTMDNDWGISTQTLNGDLGYIDEDGAGELTPGDILVYDVDNNGEITRGDLLLTGPNAGETATGTNTNLGEELNSYTGTLRYLDTQADNRFSLGDIVYLDTDNDEIVKQGAVQLSHAPHIDEPTPPSITIDAPEEGQTLAHQQPASIQGTATEGDAPLESIELTAGNDTLTVEGLETWNATWTPTEIGEQGIQATITDEIGETNTATVNVTVEAAPTQPPTIEITTPSDEDEIQLDTTVTIEGTATQGDATLETVTVQAGGETLTVDGLDEWSAEWTPTEAGVDVITATVTDENDETAQASITVTILATDPPSVIITQPEDGAQIPAGETLTIEGTASEGDVGLTTIALTADGEPLEVDGLDAWSAEWTAPTVETDQAIFIEATATDEEGLTGTHEITVTIAAPDEAPGPALPLLIASILGALAIGTRRRS